LLALKRAVLSDYSADLKFSTSAAV